VRIVESGGARIVVYKVGMGYGSSYPGKTAQAVAVKGFSFEMMLSCCLVHRDYRVGLSEFAGHTCRQDAWSSNWCRA